MHLSNSATDEKAICFLAWDLENGEAHPEEVEQLKVVKVPLTEALGMVLRGEITDATSVASILALQVRRAELKQVVPV